MDNKKIIEKIEKLLNLANSENENEARLAAKKAQELLDKHNLSMAQVGEQTYDESVLSEASRRDPVEPFIMLILQKFFHVQPFTSRRSGVTSIKLVGTDVNRQIAAYMYDFLKRSFKSAYKAERKLHGTTEIKFFYQGLYEGLCEQLREVRQTTEQESGLVVVPDAGLVKHCKEQYNFRTQSNSYRRGDAESQARGHAQGKSMQIRKGVGGGSASSGKLLG